MMHLYIHDTVIFQILEEMEPEFWYQSEKKQNTAKVDLLKTFGLTSVYS